MNQIQLMDNSHVREKWILKKKIQVIGNEKLMLAEILVGNIHKKILEVNERIKKIVKKASKSKGRNKLLDKLPC